MSELHDVPLTTEPVDRFASIVGPEQVAALLAAGERVRAAAPDRIIWNVNSTEVGGGVAEMLRPLISYARGAGVDARWVVMGATPAFFHVTKRLHNALHGSAGDGSPLGAPERAIFDEVSRANAFELLTRVRAGDVVLLHDPQTLGLAHPLRAHGAHVIWRCHVGVDERNEQTELGWAFLRGYLTDIRVCIFSRAAYVPREIGEERVAIVHPSIDPFSTKNQEMSSESVRGILAHVGLISAEPGPTAFTRVDGSAARVDRCADVMRLGPPPGVDCPLIVQVSRWDDLKDPIGVMHGFAKVVESDAPPAHLVLAGPNVHGVADDPDAARVLDDVTNAYRALPHYVRRAVTLASIPTADVDENAAIINALQRHATIVVQKSLHEGFGLTVTEAMWKRRPVVASAIGGIVDQIEDGVSGLLLPNPTDLDAFAAALKRILADPKLAAALGEAAYLRARDKFLAVRSLLEFAALVERVTRV